MLLIFDLNHVSYRCLFAAKTEILDVGWTYFKHVMFSTIFNTCKKFKATKVILAVDSNGNWRKKIYPEYKANRKENRDAQEDIKWDEFFEAFREFVSDVKKYFPFYVLQIQYMEADDIAAVIAKEFQSEEKIIVTSDSDYIQLLKYNNIKIYDPIKMEFKKCDDPEKQLKIKIVMGDKGDNITAIKPKTGIVNATKLIENIEELKKLFDNNTISYVKEDGTSITLGEEYKEKYKRNKALIDFDCIPQVLIEKTKKVISEYELPSGKEVAQYFIINKYREFNRKLEEIESIINRIKESQKQELEFNKTFLGV